MAGLEAVAAAELGAPSHRQLTQGLLRSAPVLMPLVTTSAVRKEPDTATSPELQPCRVGGAHGVWVVGAQGGDGGSWRRAPCSFLSATPARAQSCPDYARTPAPAL